ncbi:uncharacterized protein C11orf87-like [Nelusetta ayraudi]|uniref:uncharacterized protein C11orf87-like n=1 Tax=Nelusetta ayraudi TaxID=303726 RepID=UPI003F720785
MDGMAAAGSPEAAGLTPPHRCHGALRGNGTCAEQLGIFAPLSSTLALLVLLAVLVGIVLVSLATFHFHKRKLRNRKIQRAQEEYERDSRSPTRAAADSARPCVIARPVKSEGKTPPPPAARDPEAPQEEEEPVPPDC